MTVIAFDGKTLAADKRALNNGVASTVTKIGVANDKTGVKAWAVSGTLSRGLAIKEWWMAGEEKGKFPAEGKDDWACFTLFGVGMDGRTFVRLYESHAYPCVIESVPWAKGSGRDFALMAMRLGKTAEEAVRLTCELTVECGNGVDVIEIVP